MSLQNPRCAVEIWVPDVGTSEERVSEESAGNMTKLTVRAFRVEVTSNNHNEANEARIETTIDDAGIDPRFLRNAELYVYIDDEGFGTFQPNIGKGDLRSGNCRFVGIVVDVSRKMGEDDRHVSIWAQDYTCLFLQAKNGFSPRFLPDYSDSLTQAWNKICDGTGYITFDTSPPSIVSTVQRLKNRIVFEPPDLANLTLASAVSPRVAAVGAKFEVPHQEAADSWAVWQHIVGSMGLISFVRGSQVVVTTATDFYSDDDPPRMIWGLNVTEIEESRDQQSLSAKNVAVYSFNPFTGAHLESFYPPKSDITPTGRAKKKIGASALGPNIVVRAQDYDVFQCPMAISDQATLDKFTEELWQDRSRQELKGYLKTPLMYTWTNSQFPGSGKGGQGTGIPRDTPGWSLLGTQAGDRIRVEIDQSIFTEIQALPSLQARINRLKERGYSTDMAQYLAKNLSDISNVSPEFQVSKSTITLDMQDQEGSFDIRIDFVNRIYVSGSALPGQGARVPAIEGRPV